MGWGLAVVHPCSFRSNSSDRSRCDCSRKKGHANSALHSTVHYHAHCIHHCHLHRPLKTRLLQLPLSQPRLHPNTASTAHPKLTRTRCHQNAPASSYHSCP